MDACAALAVAAFLVALALEIALGEGALALLARLLGVREQQRALPLACLWALGLLVHLAALFALRLAGLAWPAASALALAPGLARIGALRRRLAGWRPRLDPLLAAWLAVAAALGASLFVGGGGGGVATPWRNNWGDLAFHLGMIARFVHGPAGPPEYHLFAGETLSYPVFANLWTASAAWIDARPATLRALFAGQWLALWAAIYALLDGRRNPGLPWALLFGGGSLAALGANAGQRIDAGFAFSAFLPTIWVTQRAAALGACAALAALRCFHEGLAHPEDGEERRIGIGAAGLVLALSPLAHLHVCLVAGAWMALALLLRLPGSGRDLRRLVLCAAPALVWLPWLFAKAGLVAPMAGWVTGDAEALVGLARAAASARAWVRDAPLWLALAGFLWWRTRAHALFAPLLLLFLAGNAVRLAVWDWDQLKVFLGVAVAFLALWSRLPGRAPRLAQAACVLLALPGVVETRLALASAPRTLYTAADLALADAVRAHTPPDAVIACAPSHDTPAALAGRRLFAGYRGTLWSHGLDFEARLRRLEDLDGLARCRIAPCPTHLLWTDAERRFWGRERPGPGFEPTPLPQLYAIPPTSGSTRADERLYAIPPTSAEPSRSSPRQSSGRAASRPPARPQGSAFSTSTKKAIAAIQRKLITPPTKSSPISAQQQPRQKAPWTRPMRKAPDAPPRHCAAKKGTGARQWSRQACFHGVSWYAPAASRIAPPSAGLVAAHAVESSAARSRPHWAAVASRLKSVHAAA